MHSFCQNCLLSTYLLFNAFFEGGALPTDVTAEQTGVSTVLVMWTAPSPPPTDGYQVQITRGSTTIIEADNVAEISYMFSVGNQYGVYSIQVRSLSRHFQSNEAAHEPVEIIARGKTPNTGSYIHKCMHKPSSIPNLPMQLGQMQLKVGSLVSRFRKPTILGLYTNMDGIYTSIGTLPPVISTLSSPTATSVTITWTQPDSESDFSIPVAEYTVTVTRLNGLTAVRCASYIESRQPVTTTSTVMSVQFTDLQEFSSYRATVTAMFSATFQVTPASSNLEFTTLSAGKKLNILHTTQCFIIIVSTAPTGVPRSLSYTVTSTTVNINWVQIECIERNGEITSYTVIFQEQGGAVIPGEVNVMDRTFTTSGLTPHTNYIFRVAGVNSNGTGPYTNDTMVVTEEDGNSSYV